MKKEIDTPNLLDMPFEQILIKNFTSEVQLRSEFVFFFLLEGTMEYEIFDRTYLARTHDIVFIKPYDIHSILNTSPDIHVLTLFIHDSFLKAFCPDFTKIDFDTSMIRFSDSDETYIRICTSLADIITFTLKTDPTARLKLMNGISSILIQLVDTFGSKKVNAPSDPDYIRERVSLILDYLNENYWDKITLNSAADLVGVHPQYFSVFFKKHFHTTFYEYLTSLRINKSLPLLINTKETITDIALNHGFSNHKTYSTSFKKIHGITPSTYRKEHTLSNKNTQLSTKSFDYFSFFQRYWKSDNKEDMGRSFQKHLTLTFLEEAKKTANKTLPKLSLSVGRATLLLRGDIQRQIIQANKDFQITSLKIRDIFSDDLFIYYEDEEKNVKINWTYIDIIFDFILSLKIKPFPEIGFMPRFLASKNQYASWNYRPNVSIPKSFKRWSLLITDFMKHLIHRYGKEEVESWNFDFWTAPNLNLKEGYWYDSKENFFMFYRVTYIAVKNVSEKIRLGSPNFSIPSGLNWYHDFFLYCQEHDMNPAYISTHLYNSHDYITPTTSKYSRFSNSWNDMNVKATKNGVGINNLSLLIELVKKNFLDQKKIIISDWNLSYIPRDLLRDTCFMAPYILTTYSNFTKIIDTVSFRSLSDITEDFLLDKKPFHGGPGLMDYKGLKKASYYTFSLISRMGDIVIDVGNHHILTRSKKSYQLLLFHLLDFDNLFLAEDYSSISYNQRYNIYESSEELVIHSILYLPKGNYRIIKKEINRSSGSAYDLWVQSGAPEEMDDSIIDYIKKRGCPDITYSMQECLGTLVIDTVLPAHGVALLEIEAIM